MRGSVYRYQVGTKFFGELVDGKGRDVVYLLPKTRVDENFFEGAEVEEEEEAS
ncbi:hypothetical protein COLO4_06529 [Corchorus olitorius]|uniref:Uncharacterized protein n=1 Tax=Corchorus olitorius TaxID=93759 RepID=A0A1R3KMR2_9ROSI|nr:hypothetical protein COLO4_06529 [Corchorus olitorius]